MLTIAPAQTHQTPVPDTVTFGVDDDIDTCRGECGARVETPGNYCDDCFDRFCCTCCGDDLEGAEECAECWEPRWIKPSENY